MALMLVPNELLYPRALLVSEEVSYPQDRLISDELSCPRGLRNLLIRDELSSFGFLDLFLL